MTNIAEEIVAPLDVPGDNHSARSAPVKLGTLAAYGSGMFVQDTLGVGLGALLLFYLNNICHMSGAAAGFAVGSALVVDSFVDPLAGSMSDNSRSRHGRRHPYMLAAILPIAIGYGLLFSIPEALSGVALFAYAMAMLMIVRVGLSYFQVPYIALGAELTDDYSGRSTVVAARVIFTVVSGLAAAFLTYIVFFGGKGIPSVRAPYLPLAWSCALLVVAGGAIATFGTLGMRSRLHAAPADDGRGVGRLFAEVAEVFRNRSFCILFAACLILFIGLGAAGQLTIYANKYFWKIDSTAIFLITVVASISYLIGVAFSLVMSRALEKRTIATLGIALIGVSQFGPAALKVAGVLPEGVDVPVLMAGSLFGGIGGACALIGFQSMMADAADEHEHLFNARREGLYFAGISFSAKASSGIGALIAGLALDLIHFPHNAVKAGANLIITPETIRSLALIYGPGAALITAASVITLMLYRRGRKEHEEVRAALVAKRGG